MRVKFKQERRRENVVVMVIGWISNVSLIPKRLGNDPAFYFSCVCWNLMGYNNTHTHTNTHTHWIYSFCGAHLKPYEIWLGPFGFWFDLQANCAHLYCMCVFNIMWRIMHAAAAAAAACEFSLRPFSVCIPVQQSTIFFKFPCCF